MSNKIKEHYLKASESCLKCVLNGYVVESVMTFKEASQRYPVQPSTLRNWYRYNVFNKDTVRKSGDIFLVSRHEIDRLLRLKNMMYKDFTVEGVTVTAKTLLYKESIDKKNSENHGVELWLDYDMDENLRFRMQNYLTFNIKDACNKLLTEYTGKKCQVDIESIIITSNKAQFLFNKDILIVDKTFLCEIVAKSDVLSEKEKAETISYSGDLAEALLEDLKK